MHEWQSLSHVRWECKYHVVLIPKYRRKVLYGKLRRQIGGILRELCRQRGVELLEGHLMADHVHMCLSIPPKYSVAQPQPLTIIARLEAKDADHVVTEREYYIRGAESDGSIRSHEFFERAWIDPSEHPRTHPKTKIEELPSETVRVVGHDIPCEVAKIDVGAPFEDWGDNIKATVCRSDEIPGRIARVSLSSNVGAVPLTFEAQLVAYAIK
jgi:REP element-mobilizing transposase RayT